ncbi:hypothetical protein C8F04DRAFT_1245965 [Mycena alexandri]|uniref:Uncharacterized protein n=1 Tax=Mycena alexandri TaxID=1745969 RepID=A0AAD6RXF7_9AGAR|nr:hypothetical protein C8F04DRAFT_1245965 [Mycena alexandri]
MAFALPPRTLRSGKEFSTFDMVVGHGAALSTPGYFDVADCLSKRIAQQEALGTADEPDDINPESGEEEDDPLPFWINPNPSPPPPPPPRPQRPHDTPPTAMDFKKEGSKRQRARKRAEVQERNGTPGIKAIHLKRRDEALGTTIQVGVDIDDLPHSKPAWIGNRNAQEDHTFEDGMGGHIYTDDEIWELTGERGMRYINWLGVLSIPIIDSHGRIIAVLGGTPRDVEGWRIITDRAATLMETKARRLRHTNEQLNHRRAQEPYPSVSCGPSYGGGQTEPCSLKNSKRNTRVTDKLLKDESFQHLIRFANLLFFIFAPVLFMYCQTQMALLRDWNPSMVWNAAVTVFTACTFNFGPHALTVPHLDFGNLAWGWCVITTLGRFNPDRGGHLILWDLKLVIRFPPGSTILIPSAIIRHSNVPIDANEFRCSFVQYTAGGLFRFIRNGFKTDHVFELTATKQEKWERAQESKTRWQEGVAMYSTIDSLRS